MVVEMNVTGVEEVNNSSIEESHTEEKQPYFATDIAAMHAEEMAIKLSEIKLETYDDNARPMLDDYAACLNDNSVAKNRHNNNRDNENIRSNTDLDPPTSQNNETTQLQNDLLSLMMINPIMVHSLSANLGKCTICDDPNHST